MIFAIGNLILSVVVVLPLFSDEYNNLGKRFTIIWLFFKTNKNTTIKIFLRILLFLLFIVFAVLQVYI